jgi:hypothetical protein
MLLREVEQGDTYLRSKVDAPVFSLVVWGSKLPDSAQQ